MGALDRLHDVLEQISESFVVVGTELVVRLGYVKVDVAKIQAN